MRGKGGAGSPLLLLLLACLAAMERIMRSSGGGGTMAGARLCSRRTKEERSRRPDSWPSREESWDWRRWRGLHAKGVGGAQRGGGEGLSVRRPCRSGPTAP